MAANNDNNAIPLIFPPIPSFATIYASQPRPRPSASHPAMRLYWTITNSPTPSIQIMPNNHTPDRATLVPYTSDHPLAKELMTNPAVPSIDVNVYQLEHWPEDWIDYHRECCGSIACGYGEHDRQTVPVSDGERSDLFDSNDVPVKLIKCCGEPRPEEPIPLHVRASDETRGVTIDNYVSAVHPWLVGNIENIVKAASMDGQISARSTLMVSVTGPESLIIETKKMWVNRRRHM